MADLCQFITMNALFHRRACHCACRETLTIRGEAAEFGISRRSMRGSGMPGPDCGDVSFSKEPSTCVDGRLPESTAHCSPKNGTPELLSICIKERSYAQPDNDKPVRPAKTIAVECFNISDNRLTGNKIKNKRIERLRRLPESASSDRCHSSLFENATSEIQERANERSSHRW